ncbi:chromosome segregation protein SMC [Shewanella avicenniae]|uniref:Chromosome partition protein Smc n=1 Tax=Shewanella avicenniae TaxID=2814294 RepID=A0ABX7QUB9_9GAMM|nr:chromosome segregation protein SMC [Shewanella avicenniae]QSX35088.1 chromosome segregation protein SMC [Shewanella avicenniae]
MRLKQIKLAGFKSFVDATKIPFLNPLTAVIGPNGCGKSNVIDAVRWVLGESSAKNLRGDSWADVIFNGSNGRKPVSVASVELVFDNTEGRIGGQFANYNEIAVKRQVSRDGDNLYFLNGQKCRKKDITDIFMGTGLGPRSYAIIGQGTISRLIECKPQELRVFIEEAAGISRYKERRRDTENRIRHTRDNLERLGDIRAELGKQLDKLTLQADAARRYREYKQQERSLNAQLLVMRYLELQQLADAENSEIFRLETELAKVQALAEQASLQLTELKLQRDDLDDLEQRQVAQFYQSNTDIAKAEQQIAFLKDRDQQLAQTQQRLQTQLAQASERHQHASAELSNLQIRHQQFEPLQQQAEELHWELSSQQEQLDERLQQLDGNWRKARVLAIELKHKQELDATKEQHLKQQLGRDQEQLQRMLQRSSDVAPVAENALAAQLAQAKQQRDETSHALQQADSDYQLQLCEQQQQRQAVDSAREALTSLRQRQQLISRWLASQQAQTDSGGQQLWQQLQVDTGWEAAVEYWLKPLLQRQWSDAAVEGFSAQSTKHWGPISAAANLTPWLGRWLFAESLTDAEQLLPSLAADQLILCKNGRLLGHGCVLSMADQLGDSLMAMRAELDEVEQALPQATQALESASLKLSLADDAVAVALVQQQALAAAVQQAQLACSKVELLMANAAQQAKLEAERQQQLQHERQILQERIAAAEFELEALIEAQFSADDALYEKQEQERRLEAQHNELQMQRNTLKSQVQESERKSRELSRQLHELTTAIALQQQQLDQAEQQQTELRAQLESLIPQHLAVQDAQQVDTLEQQLQQLLQIQQQQQQALEQTRAQQAELQKLYDQVAIKQKQQLAEAEHLTQSISTLKLRREGLKGQAESQLVLLSEQQVRLAEVTEQLPHDATIDKWHKDLENVRGKITRLGAINLAAIDEYEQQKQRKQYLDEQDHDLTQALNSLEEAIRRIDRETRTRFKTTFDQVNQGLGELFPKVFGGGSAYLALTDDDLLETGVTIMARPPGKKNSTIHLLSGGEKALTALSLVFAIFRLNPAPFCMLDEVDAPLDDANVDRFCRLLQEMSDSVQFIYISHNKITMEMADQLIGVTMHEPGVSRIVAVNIEEAVAMADAG